MGCVDENESNADFVASITEPANISALVSITQDNTGLVTITPTGEGVVSFHDVARAMLEEQDFENRMLKAYIQDWPEPDKVGKQELEIVMGHQHISFKTCKIGEQL